MIHYGVLSYFTHKLYLTKGPDVVETVKFVDTMDKFFAMNVTSFEAGKNQRKPFQQPYRSSFDLRQKLLQVMILMCTLHETLFRSQLRLENFIKYLDGWKKNS